MQQIEVFSKAGFTPEQLKEFGATVQQIIYGLQFLPRLI